jgi:hypothetical protein
VAPLGSASRHAPVPAGWGMFQMNGRSGVGGASLITFPALLAAGFFGVGMSVMLLALLSLGRGDDFRAAPS